MIHRSQSASSDVSATFPLRIRYVARPWQLLHNPGQLHPTSDAVVKHLKGGPGIYPWYFHHHFWHFLGIQHDLTVVLYYGLYGTLSSQRVPRSLQVGCSDLYGRSQNLPDPLAARLTPFFSHTRTTQVASWHLVLSESQTTGEVSRLGYSAHVPPRMDECLDSPNHHPDHPESRINPVQPDTALLSESPQQLCG